jgi:hypothetical protein
MDLNYVFLRQQVERSLAKNSASDAARKAHEELARAYELEIERMSAGRISFPDEAAVSAPPSRSGPS